MVVDVAMDEGLDVTIVVMDTAMVLHPTKVINIIIIMVANIALIVQQIPR